MRAKVKTKEEIAIEYNQERGVVEVYTVRDESVHYFICTIETDSESITVHGGQQGAISVVIDQRSIFDG